MGGEDLLNEVESTQDVCTDTNGDCREVICFDLVKSGGGIVLKEDDVVSPLGLKTRRRLADSNVEVVYADDSDSYDPMDDAADIDVDTTVSIDGQTESDSEEDDDLAVLIALVALFTLI
mgnify:CR=1 FL=1